MFRCRLNPEEVEVEPGQSNQFLLHEADVPSNLVKSFVIFFFLFAYFQLNSIVMKKNEKKLRQILEKSNRYLLMPNNFTFLAEIIR